MCNKRPLDPTDEVNVKYSNFDEALMKMETYTKGMNGTDATEYLNIALLNNYLRSNQIKTKALEYRVFKLEKDLKEAQSTIKGLVAFKWKQYILNREGENNNE